MNTTDTIVVIAVTAAVFVVLLWLGYLWGRLRVARWCRRNGYELLYWRGAWLSEGPRKWLRTDNEEAYYIEVRDRMGLVRAGYLTYGTWYNPFARQGEVHWD